MKRIHRYLAAYDISDDRERSRLDKLLKGFGFRVQKSVFEVRADTSIITRLGAAIEALALESGHVRLYRLSGSAHAQTYGLAPEEVDQDFAFIL